MKTFGNTMISRVGFCERCAKERRPITDQPFVVVGKNFHVLFASHIGMLGFTPHFYRQIKVIGENVKYERLCGMDQCGVTIWWDQAMQKYKFSLQNYLWQTNFMSIESWTGLEKYKHDYDYEI